MEAILDGLMELSGARAAMVLDATGQVIARRGKIVEDRGVCEQVGGCVVRAVESIELQQQDWETITARYANGRILLRGIAIRGGQGRYVLALVADATLNTPFATVALRVTAGKVRSAIEGTSSQVAPAASQPPGAAYPAPAAPPGDSRPVLANTGLSWSRVAGSSADSTVGLSGVMVADPASGAFLTRCAKELARHVGPIAKVYVQEAVRRVSPEGPFALSRARQLVDDLAGQVEDPGDRAKFRKAALER